MNAEELGKLEDRITNYASNLPELIALLLYRQFHRGRGLKIDGIDRAIRREIKTAEIASGCACTGRHSGDTPFSHYIALDV